MNYTVVIPVLNQLQYTQQCVDSLRAGGTAPGQILVINNGSTDDSSQWLHAQAGLRVIDNPVNLGCGGAWAQGALVANADWVVLLNNDVIVPPGGMQALLEAAERAGLKAVSPGLMEGKLDYDFNAWAPKFSAEMRGVLRTGWFHGVCFAVHRSVFESIGFPDTDRLLGGHEDKEFLVRCLRHGIPVGTVGDTVLHHFGSITQKALKENDKKTPLGDRHYSYRRMGMGWLARRRFRSQLRRQLADASQAERAAHGMSLHMLRDDRGGWTYL